MMCGQEPGSAKSEITWTKIANTTLARMEDGSLIHLLTCKKKIKKRTKLLNSHLREHAHQTISYPDYIKVKTAVLRTLSDDEETSDDSILSDDHDFEKPHVHSDNPKTSALRTLLKDMMLDSQSSSEEFQEIIPRQMKLGKKNRKFSASYCENNKTPVIVKRPRGRPRKYPLITSNNNSGTKPINTFFTSSHRIKSEAKNIYSSQQVNHNHHLTSDIVTIIVDNHENSNASNISNTRDPLAHNLMPGEMSNHDSHIYEKISKMICDGVDPQIAADASKIYSTDDSDNGEFKSPQTTDCDASSDEGCSTSKDEITREEHDDMFEEEKIITQEELIIGNEHGHILINEFSPESIVQDSQMELSEYDEKKEKNQIVDSEEESIVFTQEFDANNHANVNNIEDYVEQVVKQFDEKFSDNLMEISHKKMLESPKELVINPEKFNGHEEKNDKVVNELDKSTEKTIIKSEVRRKISQSSPKTPADVKRNLMASLNSLSIEKSIINDPFSNLDGEDSRPDDLCSLPPQDSGIDDDSETILFRESPKFIVKDVEKNEKMISPSKKLPNLKITCTEVVKSKYMIIKNRQEEKCPIKSLPQAIQTLKSLNDSENEDNNDFILQYSNHEDDNHHNNIPSFREQLNNYDSDYNDNYYEENERKKLKRNPISLTIPSESESLKYVLNSLSGREYYVRNHNEDESDVLQRELLLGENSESNNDSDNEGKTLEYLPRPTNIQEFIEGNDFVPLNGDPSFTLADIGDDEDIYLMEIPKTLLEVDLEGQIFKLTERRIIIGNERYNIQKKEAKAMSCILHCGDDRHIYKTGIIEPIGHILVERKMRDDVITIPKVELESSMTVPFPKNIKSRHPHDDTQNTEENMNEAIVQKKKKKKSKERKKLFYEGESLIDIKKNSVLDIEEANLKINEDSTIKKRNKKAKKHKKLNSKKQESSIIPENIEKSVIKENEEVNHSNNEEFHVPKKMKKSKKRKRLSEEGIDNCDVNESEVESNFKAKKRKYDHEGEEMKRVNENEIEIPKKSFYDQMMDDSD